MGSFVSPQMWEYEGVVNNFFAGKGLVIEVSGANCYSFVSPLYPIICIIVYFFTGHSFLAIFLLQAMVSAFTCIIIFWIGKEIFGRNTGLLSAAVVALHPGFIIYSTKLHPFVFDTFFICLVAWFLIKTKHCNSWINQLKLGVSFGLGVLTRGTLFFLIPFCWLWLRRRSRGKFVFFIIITAIIISPWLTRNYLIYKKVMLLSGASNFFWRGNNPLASGTALSVSGKAMLEDDKGMNALVYGKSELEQNRIYWGEGIKFMKNKPIKFILLNFKKFFYFWWFAPTTGSEYSYDWLRIYKVYYFALVLFSIFGLISLKGLTDKCRFDAFMLIVLMLGIAVAQSIFYVETRHRWAIEPLLIIFSMYGLVRIAQYLKINFKERSFSPRVI